MTVEALLRQRERRFFTVPVNKTLEATAMLMRTQNINAVVITDFCATEGEAVLGVVTRQDVAAALDQQGQASISRPISKLRTNNLVYCHLKEPLPDLIGMMQKRSADYAVVMDHHSVVGLIEASEIFSSGNREFDLSYNSGALQ